METEQRLGRHINSAVRDMIQAALVAHLLTHDGDYMRCPDRHCTELRIDLIGLIELDHDVDRLREAMR